MHNKFKMLAAASLLAIGASAFGAADANAWGWGNGPWDGNGNGWGNGTGSGNFSMNFGGNAGANGWGNAELQIIKGEGGEPATIWTTAATNIQGKI